MRSSFSHATLREWRRRLAIGPTIHARLAMCVTLATLPLGACEPTIRQQGQGGLLASYSGMTLTANLPEPARVPAIIAAADGVVRSRGYGVSTQKATEEEGRLLALPPGSASYPRVWIHAARIEGGARIEINPQPWGDEDLARSLLDGILSRLGI
jgi:hypothetical protein